jgi:hypothetical protein
MLLVLVCIVGSMHHRLEMATHTGGKNKQIRLAAAKNDWNNWKSLMPYSQAQRTTKASYVKRYEG